MKALSLTGMAFAVEHLPDLIAALQEAEAHAAEHGLINEAPHADLARGESGARERMGEKAATE